MDNTSPTPIHQIDNILHHHQVSIDIINNTLSSQASNLIFQQSDIAEIKLTLRQLSQTLAEISSKPSSKPDSPIHPPSPTPFASPLSKTQNSTNLNYGQVANNLIDTPLPSPPSTVAMHPPVPSKTASSNNIDNVSTIQTISLSPTFLDAASSTISSTLSYQPPSCSLSSQPAVIQLESHSPTTPTALKSFFHPSLGSTTLNANRNPPPFLQLTTANSPHTALATTAAVAMISTTAPAISTSPHVMASTISSPSSIKVSSTSSSTPTSSAPLFSNATSTTIAVATISLAAPTHHFISFPNQPHPNSSAASTLNAHSLLSSPSQNSPSSVVFPDRHRYLHTTCFPRFICHKNQQGLWTDSSHGSDIIITYIDPKSRSATKPDNSCTDKPIRTELLSLPLPSTKDLYLTLSDLQFGSQLDQLYGAAEIFRNLDALKQYAFNTGVVAYLENLEVAQCAGNEIKLGYESLFKEMMGWNNFSFYVPLQPSIRSPETQNQTKYIFPPIQKFICVHDRRCLELQNDCLTPFTVTFGIKYKLRCENQMYIFDPGGKHLLLVQFLCLPPLNSPPSSIFLYLQCNNNMSVSIGI